MRLTICAALVLSPALLHAQATVPATTSTISQHAPVLQAGLAEPKALHAESDRNVPTDDHVRVSTGFVAPKLIYSINVESEMDWQWRVAGKYRTAVVALVVDATGKPSNLKIVKSTGGLLDQNVLAAVSQYRFKPATVSNQPVAAPVDLEVNIVNPLLQ